MNKSQQMAGDKVAKGFFFRTKTYNFCVRPETAQKISEKFGRVDIDLVEALANDVMKRFFNETYWNQAFRDPDTVQKYLQEFKADSKKAIAVANSTESN